MVGDDKKIERSGQFGLQPCGRLRLFPHRKAQRLFWRYADLVMNLFRWFYQFQVVSTKGARMALCIRRV
jgi:hypothetical protein